MATASIWTDLQSEAWVNERAGAERASKLFPTKEAAQADGKTAKCEKVAHLIRGRKRKVGERNGYGNDQRLSKV